MKREACDVGMSTELYLTQQMLMWLLRWEGAARVLLPWGLRVSGDLSFCQAPDYEVESGKCCGRGQSGGPRESGRGTRVKGHVGKVKAADGELSI